MKILFFFIYLKKKESRNIINNDARIEETVSDKYKYIGIEKEI